MARVHVPKSSGWFLGLMLLSLPADSTSRSLPLCYALLTGCPGNDPLLGFYSHTNCHSGTSLLVPPHPPTSTCRYIPDLSPLVTALSALTTHLPWADGTGPVPWLSIPSFTGMTHICSPSFNPKSRVIFPIASLTCSFKCSPGPEIKF